MTKKLNLAIVDDDHLIVQFLSDFFKSEGTFNPHILAYSGHTFIEKLSLNESYTDLILLDLRMNDGDGLFVIDELITNYPQIKIVILSSHASTTFIGQMLKLGVSAMLPKQIDKEELLNVLKEVMVKGHYFSNDQLIVLRKQIKIKTPQLTFNPKDQLTEREVEVLELICQQYTAKEIAKKLFISVKAVETRKSNLMLKMNVKNTAGLIITAVKYKLVDPEKIILV
ncbi:MAG: DNA-binding NarL/FixJ family response regulator [Crocinitomix sp.]|jgi:DNA-binding NarL/FixJ family response regulator